MAQDSVARVPITADDEFLRNAVSTAFLPSLLANLAHLTGDLTLLRPHLSPDPTKLREEQAGYTPEQQEEARAMVLEALIRYRDLGSPPPPSSDMSVLRSVMRWLTGDVMTDDYLPLLREELAVDDVDPRAPQWQKEQIAADRDFRVMVIGAGMSGLAAAHRLAQAGVDFTVVEKNADVGGTWFENTYPGCRVDSSNYMYSYSFAQRSDWPNFFSPQPVLLDYFRTCAERFGIRDRIRFHTEVRSTRWDDDEANWIVELDTPSGPQTERAHAIISAVGQLNRPKMPQIAGMERFGGPSFHSARWDHSVDLKGKRVAVIGTGASAVQFIPIIAKDVAQLDIFQRTPNWLAPVENYLQAVPEGFSWLLSNVPYYAQWHRFMIFWRSAEGLLPAARVEEGWTPRDRSVGARNDELRELLTMYLDAVFADRPDLAKACIPQYPPASKRIVLDDGTYPASLKRENVHMYTEKISEITPTGIITADGVSHDADVIIYATGFLASHFLTPMRVVGRENIELNEQWDGDARAYVGVTVPNFPNLFLLYGPNTNIVVNGSIIYFSECEVRYVLDAVRLLLANNLRSLDVKREVHDAYNQRIDAGNLSMAWGVSTVNSWYKADSGRVAQNWPFSLLEYWQQTVAVNPDDYELI